jgi:hypothetical protein
LEKAMSDIPNDEAPVEPNEVAPTEKLSPPGITAMQGDDDDNYRRVLEKPIRDQTARLPDYKDDPDNKAALEADIRDANERLMRDVKRKHGIEPQAELSESAPAEAEPVEALEDRVARLKAETEAREAAELAQLKSQPQETPPPAPPQPDKPEPPPPPTPTGSQEKEREPTIERPPSPEGA